MPAWEITYGGRLDRTIETTRREWSGLLPFIRVRALPGTSATTVTVGPDDVGTMALMQRVGGLFSPRRPEETVVKIVEQLMLQQVIPRVEMVFAAGGQPEEMVELGRDDLEDLERRLLSGKACAWQIDLSSALWCRAGVDESPVIAKRIIADSTISATTDHLCSGCEVPDKRVVCTDFVHPIVMGTVSDGTQISRSVRQVQCNRGRKEIQTDASLCHAGGHGCWRRVVELERPVARTEPPLALVEALDFLDAVWQLAFGHQHLLGTTAYLHIARVETPVLDRKDLTDRLSDLVDILDNMEVPVVPNQSTSREGTLVRMRTFLGDRIADAESRSRVEDAITLLRQVPSLRAAVQHSDAAAKMPAALGTFGVDYPPHWPMAWEQIKAGVVGALAVLRDEIRRLDTQD